MSKELAELIFPDLPHTYEEYEAMFPVRPESVCTRFAPSPTGYMHIGGLYTALINSMVTKHENGVFYLRIEDTDQKRILENGVSEIIDTLASFDVRFDEGAVSETEDAGKYGPYRQSERKAIYQAFAKHLLEADLAYPCFCTEDGLNAIREKQEAEGALQKGYYGKWAACRQLSEAEAIERIKNGERYVVRLRSQGTEGKMRTFTDTIRGEFTMPENFLDTVIIKGDGLPTYHFAHAVDDHLMRTSDVIRADEWIASLPIHVELFETLGFQVPRYAHLSPIMKQELKEDGVSYSKRKLSKRKDPEARVRFYDEAGYPVQAVLDYLLTIASSAYEPWREENMDASIFDFAFDLTKTGVAGALFDFDKLKSISKKRIAHMSCDEVFEKAGAWAKQYDGKLAAFIEKNPEAFRVSVPLWHDNRLDVAKWSDLSEMYPYLYDESFAVDADAFKETFAKFEAHSGAILREYLETFSYADDASEWFNKLRTIAENHNYAVKMGQYKKHPEEFNGSIADLSSMIRYAVTGSLNSPDLHGIVHMLGENVMRSRVQAIIDVL